MQVVTVVPMHGYINHAARLTPHLQAWMDSAPERYAPWLGYAHNLLIPTLCNRRPGNTKSVYTIPFESLENEVKEYGFGDKVHSVCTKCQRILRESRLKGCED